VTTITQNVADIAGVDDNTSWTFYTPQIRQYGAAIVTPKKVRKYPVAGVLTVVLDPGPAVVVAPDGNRYPFTVPGADSDLWTLIAGAIGMPPGTTQQAIAAAVADYLNAHQIQLDEYHEYANFAAFPSTGVADRIYVDISTTPATFYRWTGSVYAVEGGGGGTPTDGSVTVAKVAPATLVTAAETIAANNNDTTLPTSAAVQAAITAAVTALLNGAPSALDTLKELADALNDDASFAATVTAALAAKAPLASPTFTGTVAGITKAMVGLGSADNVSDVNKPVSTAQAAADAATLSSANSSAASADTTVLTTATGRAVAFAVALG
jgi:formaldehyde-activating enzyme involved in methanogenesis